MLLVKGTKRSKDNSTFKTTDYYITFTTYMSLTIKLYKVNSLLIFTKTVLQVILAKKGLLSLFKDTITSQILIAILVTK
jgi:hypothetical protein